MPRLIQQTDLLEAQGHKPTSVRASQPRAVRSSGRVRRSDEAFGSGSNAEQVGYIKFYQAPQLTLVLGDTKVASRK